MLFRGWTPYCTQLLLQLRQLDMGKLWHGVLLMLLHHGLPWQHRNA